MLIMGRTLLTVAISSIAFALVLFFGLPKILPRASAPTISNEQRELMKKGSLSSQILRNSLKGKVITEQELNYLDGHFSASDIFTSDLIFKGIPNVSHAEKNIIAQAQRIQLLENEIAAFGVKISNQSESAQWTWEWSLEKVWVFAIWFFGTVATSVLSCATESAMNRLGNNGYRKD